MKIGFRSVLFFSHKSENYKNEVIYVTGNGVSICIIPVLNTKWTSILSDIMNFRPYAYR